MAVDKAEEHGVPMPQPGAVAATLLKAQPPGFRVRANPVDMTTAVMSTPEILPVCANALLEDPAYGALIIPITYAWAMTPKRLPHYAEAARRAGKPVILLWLTEWLEGPGAVEFEACPDVALFRSMDRAFRAIAGWQSRHRRLSTTAEVPHRTSPSRLQGEGRRFIQGAAHDALD